MRMEGEEKKRGDIAIKDNSNKNLENEERNMSKKTIMKPIAAMLLAFALLLTGVVPGTLATAKAAEDETYAVFVYEDENGNKVTSEHIKDESTFVLNQNRKGKFYVYDGGELITTGSTPWSGNIIQNAGSGVGIYDPDNASTNAFVHTGRGRFMGMAWLSFNIKIVVDTEALDNTIVEAEKLTQGNYSDETWKEFKDTLDEAKNWSGKIEADQAGSASNAKYKVTQDNIDEATATLNDAMVALNREDLQTAVKKAEDVKNDNYTEESWKAFQDALKAAKDMQEEDASADDIKEAIEALNTAMTSLKKKPAEVPTTTAKKEETTAVVKEETPVVLAKTALKKAKKSGNKVQLTWKKVKAATGYEVYQATKKNGKYKKVKTVKKNKVVTCKTKALKAKKTYFFKVRTYRKVAGKTVYGEFSNVKKVVLK